MLHPVLERLKRMKLSGMVQALEEQLNSPDVHRLSFEERLGLLADREQTLRDNRSLKNRLTKAKLRRGACMEELDYCRRDLDKELMASLESCQWITQHKNVLVIGPTGTGKTFLAEALAHKACLKGRTALCVRTSRFFTELGIAKGDGSYLQKLARLSKIDVLVLDDLGVAPLGEEACRDLLEIMDDRHGYHSTIITSQLPIKNWHDTIGNSTLADAILDRLVHNAYKIELKGESMRKLRAQLPA